VTIAAIWRGEVLVAFPGLDSSDSLDRFERMRTEVAPPAKRSASARPKVFKVGDRATFAASVLRVLPGEAGTLLVMVDATGIKLTVPPKSLKGGNKLRGSDKVTLTGTVTRVGSSMVEGATPISLAVDGYTASRVTLSAKSLGRA
jgi:hypothetical protein